jgi:hypothetical protein
MILYHFFGRDRGYDIISSKKRICPMSANILGPYMGIKAKETKKRLLKLRHK